MFEFVNRYIIGAALPSLLVAAGVFLGIYTHVWSPRALRSGARSLLARKKTNTVSAGPDKKPGTSVSPLRALSLALAGTLGVGNIVGVSAAIWWGGPGAVFWMWLYALLADSLKYSESLLGVKHSRLDCDRMRGGAPI